MRGSAESYGPKWISSWILTLSPCHESIIKVLPSLARATSRIKNLVLPWKRSGAIVAYAGIIDHFMEQRTFWSIVEKI